MRTRLRRHLPGAWGRNWSLYFGNNRRVLRECYDDATFDCVVTDPPYGINFMSKAWDHGVPGVDYWREILRVTKPGGHALVFGGTRKWHRLACEIEDAGWEIRDSLMWLYLSGFPKSMDVSKAVDKELGAERAKVRIPGRLARQPSITGAGRNGRLDYEVKWVQRAMEVGYHEKAGDDPVTDEAKLWDGYGTTLKPAVEPIILAMRPTDGTFAQNALRHGVAGLNVGGTRIGDDLRVNAPAGGDNLYKSGHRSANDAASPRDCVGRFPANVIMDDRVARALGGPSRIFYTAKAPPSERDGGNLHPTVKPISLMRYLCRLLKPPQGGKLLDPFVGSGSTLIAAVKEGYAKAVGIEKGVDEWAWLTGRMNAFERRRPYDLGLFDEG